MSSNSQPLVTIGIPTYNRPHFLRESLASALNQSYPNIEVVVSDNSENDESQKVVEEIGDSRVRYSRNERNMGSNYNWMRCLEMASGEYFGWLQDDDLLMREFVSRGIQAFLKNPEISAYYAYVTQTFCPFLWSTANIYGPKLPLNWRDGIGSVFSRNLVLPMSLLQSVGFFPACLYRKNAIHNIFQCHFQLDKYYIFSERFFQLEVAKNGDFYADAFIGAIFRKHPNQLSINSYFDDRLRKWNAEHFLKTVEETFYCDNDHFKCFFELLEKLPADKIYSIYLVAHWEILNFYPKNRLVLKVTKVFQDVLNMKGFPKPLHNSMWFQLTKGILRNITPPILYSFAKKVLKISNITCLIGSSRS